MLESHNVEARMSSNIYKKSSQQTKLSMLREILIHYCVCTLWNSFRIAKTWFRTQNASLIATRQAKMFNWILERAPTHGMFDQLTARRHYWFWRMLNASEGRTEHIRVQFGLLCFACGISHCGLTASTTRGHYSLSRPRASERACMRRSLVRSLPHNGSLVLLSLQSVFVGAMAFKWKIYGARCIICVSISKPIAAFNLACGPRITLI
jgi:hypothetical protein